MVCFLIVLQRIGMKWAGKYRTWHLTNAEPSQAFHNKSKLLLLSALYIRLYSKDLNGSFPLDWLCSLDSNFTNGLAPTVQSETKGRLSLLIIQPCTQPSVYKSLTPYIYIFFCIYFCFFPFSFCFRDIRAKQIKVILKSVQADNHFPFAFFLCVSPAYPRIFICVLTNTRYHIITS